MSGPGDLHPLVGGWRLRSWESIRDDASDGLPMGGEPDGILIYSLDGTMTGIMSQAGRPRLSTDDVTGGTVKERAQAYATFIAYGGTYHVDGDMVTHRVEASLFPNWIGTTQRRRWALDASGRYLTLTSPPLTLGGVSRIQRLRWERSGADRFDD